MAFQFIAVGTSLGGFQALKTLLGGLPGDFPVPVAIVQHRSSAQESDILAPLLSSHSPLPVIEVEDKQEILERHVYIGPPNYHLLVDGGHFALSTDAPVLFARPSIDVLFESAAEFFRQGAVGVLLTGMSRDGTAGLTRIKECGGFAVVQDPESAEGPLMPRSAIASVAVDRILPIDQIAPFLVALCPRQRAQHEEFASEHE